MESTVLSILLLIIIYLLFSIIKLEGRLKKMNYMLKQIAEKLDVKELPINNEVKELLKEGKETEAVKLVRETLGLSLIEAKQYVDSLK